MSEDNDPRPKSASTDSKTIIGTGKPTEGSGAHRRPGEYIVTRKEVSGAHKVPMPERTGVGKANDKTTILASDAPRPLPGIAPVAKSPSEATVVIPGPAAPLPAPPTTMPQATPLPQPVPVDGGGAGAARQRGAERRAERRLEQQVGPAFEGRHRRRVRSRHDRRARGGAAPHPGVRINQYEMIKMIGEGGMGTVFLARDLRLGRRVAIKFLQTQQPELTQRFLVEARATARCQHENIVVIYEVGEHDGAPYMVLEFLNGKPLTAASPRTASGCRTRARSRSWSRCCARSTARTSTASSTATSSPTTSSSPTSGTIKVLDFGIAKVLRGADRGARRRCARARIRMPSPLELATGSNTSLTRIGTIMGTLKYMSPEQWGIGVEIDHLTDIWACGILLHRMICGRHPLHPLDGNQLVVTAMLELPMPSMAEAAPPDCPARAVADRRPLPAQDEGAALAERERAAARARAVPAGPPHARSSRSTRARTPACRRSRRTTPASSSAATARSPRWSRGSATAPLMAVVGSSGVGKSSFVRAGLVPALKRSGETWETLVIRPGRKPLEALAALIAPMVATAANLADEIERAEEARRDAAQRARPPRPPAARPRAPRQRAASCCSSISSRSSTRRSPIRRERAAFTACLAARRRRRDEPAARRALDPLATSSTASPRTRRSSPS